MPACVSVQVVVCYIAKYNRLLVNRGALQKSLSLTFSVDDLFGFPLSVYLMVAHFKGINWLIKG